MLQAAMKSGIPAVLAATADDRRLADACASGDTKVFEELYRRFGSRMMSIAWNHLGDAADAEDAVQETFLKVHRSARSWNGEASFATWMIRILVNTCLDALRRRKKHAGDTALDETVTDIRPAVSVDDNKRIALRRLLDELPEQKRMVFTLFEIEGLSHAEIAGILGITEGNSKWILFATKKQLQEKWTGSR
jgi:RNA polymerase sigma factor (sigma-70 family)